MPPDFSDWMPGDHLLSIDELMTVISIAVDEGVTSIRLTGGEPLIRPDIVEIVARINALPTPPRINLTTNALKLAELAQPLADAGLERVNISLDTLDAERFKRLTFRDRYSDVIAGIEAALAAGLHPVKVNTVLMRGINDDEAVPMLRHAVENGWHLRFIEQMPLDAQGSWDRAVMVTAAEIHDLLESAFTLTPVAGTRVRAGRGVPRRRRPGHGRHHRQRQQAVLRSVRPAAPHRRRADPQLPLRARRDGCPRHPARRVAQRGRAPRAHRGAVRRLDPREAPRARDRRPVLHPAGPTDERDRRLGRMTVYLVAGPPAVGKSTVTRLMARRDRDPSSSMSTGSATRWSSTAWCSRGRLVARAGGAAGRGA